MTLHPQVTIEANSDEAKALALHEEAHHNCFIANSVNFPVKNVARIIRKAAVA
jgi:organic hydroperoxide reductase OsmC/OhrA